ncbi:hypothetical protein FQN51_002299 [Onygenales sp. PD_10]|nr:hypothetical protein FQN51_002299 [Onygenales sp. PD_10]
MPPPTPTPTPSLPPITTLPSLPTPRLTTTLDTLFESSPALHTLILPLLTTQPFPSYPALIDAIGARMTALSAQNSTRDREVLRGILGAHPRLGERRKEGLSELSRREQGGLDGGVGVGVGVGGTEEKKGGGGEEAEAEAEAEAAELRRLNGVYEEKFPGLRYVVFVNGRPRNVIMQDMRRRIDRGDFEREIEEIIQAMCDIANDRAKKLENTE